mmetsp:Transcript_24286/g.20649  ORF Transcript_24286/g.20649 Transcript_24286/m.20649 type:complete len:97 (+) Transcript_24286:2-292(+)
MTWKNFITMHFGVTVVVIWSVVLMFLILATLTFLLFRKARTERLFAKEAEINEEKAAAGLRRLTFHSPDERERLFVQSGHRRCWFGAFLLIGWQGA